MKQLFMVAMGFGFLTSGAGDTLADDLTPIPFDIGNFTQRQRDVLSQANLEDDSLNCIRTRPVLFQVVLAGDGIDQTRGPGRIDRDTEILIYGLGEIDSDGKRMLDYGWFENVETGEKLWEMTAESTVHAGGDTRNRKSAVQMTLPPGVYRLRYVTNESHSFSGWQGEPPERERFYGTTVFNLSALPLLEEKLKSAGAPNLGSSLKRPYTGPRRSLTKR